MPLHRSPQPISWPHGKRFAFTIIDDTDGTTLVNGPPVYAALTAAGLRVTKTVWVHDSPAPTPVGGTSCADPAYRHWVLELRDAGHEIALHNARDHPSTRAETAAALEAFRATFGQAPRLGADHSHNREALYAGSARLSGARGVVYRAAVALTRPGGPDFSGHLPTSAYFWGDLCRDQVTYWRGFTFPATNVLEPCPVLPYHDPSRPFVNWWFCATDAPDLESFLRATSPSRLDRLEAQGGVCILYTHLGLDTAPEGRVDPRFTARLQELAARDAWFAPVSQVLDHLLAQPGDRVLTRPQRAALERRWLVGSLHRRAGREARWLVLRAWRALTGRGATRWQRPGAA